MVPQSPSSTAFAAQRSRLLAFILNLAQGHLFTALRMLAAGVHDEGQAVGDLLTLGQSGIANTVDLVNAYLALVTGAGPQQMDASRYMVAALRPGQDPARVYSQPFMAWTVARQQGGEPAVAWASAVARLDKVISTDLQLAQTHAARDWMANESRVVGWRRVIADADPCELCRLASERTYHKQDLMPIHEHCHCIVEPVLEPVELSAIDATVRVAEGDIGPRLLAEDWKA